MGEYLGIEDSNLLLTVFDIILIRKNGFAKKQPLSGMQLS
jgi:hypothetical protein